MFHSKGLLNFVAAASEMGDPVCLIRSSKFTMVKDRKFMKQVGVLLFIHNVVIEGNSHTITHYNYCYCNINVLSTICF